jgi:threonine dehydratase
MERAGARVLADGKTYDEADAQAGELQRQEGMTLVHPFDDPLVIAGQGTLALEIQEDLPDVAEILVPLSGGGLAAGVAYALKSVSPHATVTAVSAQRASVMLESLAAGKPIEMAEEGTIASALSGGIGLDNTYTFAMVRDWIDRHLSVPEEAILEAMAYALSHLHLVVEGGGAVALAAILAGLWVPLSDSGPTVIVLSGGNLDPKRLHEVALGDRLRH